VTALPVERGGRWSLRRIRSRVMYALCTLCAVAIVTVLALVTAYILRRGVPFLSLDFFTRPAGTDPKADPGGMGHAITGTLVLIGLASIVGIPLGILTGVYLSEYRGERWLVTPTRFLADVLAGVPSIVVGILGYELLVVPLNSFNGWAGAMALAFIMVPIVARTTEEMLRLVPRTYREASLALGATKAQTIVRVVLPAATGSMITGVMLAMARVAGETAPLLFTALGSRFMPIVLGAPPPYIHGDLSKPFPSLTAQIFTYSTGPYQEYKNLAWAGIVTLIGLLFILNLSIRLLAGRTLRRVRA
jgi:phosphate transport system permease protein